MSIEELPDPGSEPILPSSTWATTVLTLGAGVLIGVVMMCAIGPVPPPDPAPSPTQSPALAIATDRPSPSPTLRPPTPPTPPLADTGAIGLTASVRQSLWVDRVSFSFSVPTEGWARYGGLYISKSTHGPQGAEAMIFWARHPAGNHARACGPSPAVPIGYKAGQVAESLATGLPGTELVSGPSDVVVGGLPAKQVVLSVRDTTWCGPGFFYTWDGEESRGGPLWGSPMLGDTITIWVLDLEGERFVIAAETHLNAGPELEAEVLQIVDSIEFVAPCCEPGLHSTTVDGTVFSFAIETSGWGPYPGEPTPASILISKDVVGSQEAEEVIYWAGWGQSYEHTACGVLGDPGDPPTALGVATRVASAPGVDLVSGPEDVNIGGHHAVEVVVTVRESLGCDLGFFYSWTPQRGGALWIETGVGDTIRVWVVEVDAGLFFISALTKPAAADHEMEIQHIIDSIEFE